MRQLPVVGAPQGDYHGGVAASHGASAVADLLDSYNDDACLHPRVGFLRGSGDLAEKADYEPPLWHSGNATCLEKDDPFQAQLSQT